MRCSPLLDRPTKPERLIGTDAGVPVLGLHPPQQRDGALPQLGERRPRATGKHRIGIIHQTGEQRRGFVKP